MFIGKNIELSRRAFIRRSSQLSVMGAASSYALGLASIGEAAAFSTSGDYKALVCLFLYGGNDHSNTLIPFDATNYARYSAIRGGDGEGGGGIALPRASLGQTVLNPRDDQVLTDDQTFALAPTMPRIKQRFDEGRLAPLLNVGPLIAPTTLSQYENETVPLPPKLFSHNDQQSIWQSSQTEGAPSGWGGRISDLALSSNTNSMFSAINAFGNTVFLSGQDAVPYQVAPHGATLFQPISGNPGFLPQSSVQALETILRSGAGHFFKADYAHVNARSIEYGNFVNNALNNANLQTDFPEGNFLAAQLQVVARLIAARNRLGVTRQVFMVGMGGYDTHDGLIGQHEGLLAQVDEALDAFYRSTVEIGISDKVTTFTASDFGRTFTSNGDGSDHGWGSHHFILGGDVDGGRFYGRAPHISVDTDDQVGQGRLLPDISVDQYSATLARWFGVSPSEMPSVAPNIGRFASSDLGFMKDGAI